MNILVLNCGSSSLKFQIIETDLEIIEKSQDRQKAKGLVERISSEALITLRAADQPVLRQTAPLSDHRRALEHVLNWLVSEEAKIPGISAITDIQAVGHRVVHGGEKFSRSVVINEEIIRQIEECIDLAPLHNPANLKGIHAAVEIFGGSVPQVAVFDTSFHSTLPEVSYLYAIPYEFYTRHKVRRYGFHGTSHRYVAYRYRQLTGKETKDTNVITLHLGNGCSASAIKHGESINTSMGFTPLEGLVMGTRGGDIDPAVLQFLHHKEGMSFDELDAMLNKRSGLLGISGITNDMRDLLEKERVENDRRAKLAIEMFCLRAKKYIGAYMAQMNGVDALVFTGGIGENSPEIRRRVCADLDALGILIDTERNAAVEAGSEGEVSAPASRVKIYVIPTNEELLIARDTVRCVLNAPRRW